LSIYVTTYGTNKLSISEGEIAEKVGKLFDLRPAAIVKRYGLKNPIFEATASYGHFGNRPYSAMTKIFEGGVEVEREIEFFGWERLDAVDAIKAEFAI
ncbi:MAG: methionine adenosyltransferase domain-containing protein, partial [Rikenellaceae bacterium]